jgi:hypothetical protein
MLKPWFVRPHFYRTNLSFFVPGIADLTITHKYLHRHFGLASNHPNFCRMEGKDRWFGLQVEFSRVISP